jgi:hypothetical protein
MQPPFESIRLAAQLRERQLRADAARSRPVPRSDTRHHGSAAWRGLSRGVIATIARARQFAAATTGPRCKHAER